MPSPEDVARALKRWQTELTESAEKIGEVLSGDDIEPDDQGEPNDPPEPTGSWWDGALAGRYVTPAVMANLP